VAKLNEGAEGVSITICAQKPRVPASISLHRLKTGLVAIEAGHATAALDICRLRADEVDVLFTDIRMPGPMDGLELAHHVRERWPKISVVIASGNRFVSADELQAGARFLAKPYDMQRVVDLIQELRRR
jgi:two-component system, response regulator PdtaR